MTGFDDNRFGWRHVPRPRKSDQDRNPLRPSPADRIAETAAAVVAAGDGGPSTLPVGLAAVGVIAVGVVAAVWLVAQLGSLVPHFALGVLTVVGTVTALGLITGRVRLRVQAFAFSIGVTLLCCWLQAIPGRVRPSVPASVPVPIAELLRGLLDHAAGASWWLLFGMIYCTACLAAMPEPIEMLDFDESLESWLRRQRRPW